jgi:hypothetical protein
MSYSKNSLSQCGIHNKHMSHYIFLPPCRISPSTKLFPPYKIANISIMPTLANHAVIFSEPLPPCEYYYDLFSSCESITNFPLHSGNNLKRDMHANIGLHSIIEFKIQKVNLNKTITHTCLIRH